MKLLVIEDHPSVSHFLQKGLQEAGHTVDICSNGQQGLELALTQNYQLIIMDGLLPSLDGWTITQKIRAAGLRTKIIFLSARDHLEDRIRGLDAGADCYLVKPFSFSELLAQVRTLLRSDYPPLLSTDLLKVEDLEMDLKTHRAYRAGKKLDLTHKEYCLLLVLMRRKGDVLSRTVLVEQVWNMDFDTHTNIVDVHIRRLRSKVDDPFPKKLIHTVRGFGYTLDGSLS